MKTYTIKPLEWKEITRLHETRYFTDTLGIGITKLENDCYEWSYCIDEYYNEDSNTASTLEEAKAKCEEIYTNHITQFLNEVTI